MVQKIQEGWWRVMLKDSVTNLYTRVDIVKQADHMLTLTLSISGISAEIEITFHNGELSVLLVRRKGDEAEIIAKKVMKIDANIVWEDEDQGNT